MMMMISRCTNSLINSKQVCNVRSQILNIMEIRANKRINESTDKSMLFSGYAVISGSVMVKIELANQGVFSGMKKILLMI